MPGTLRVGIDVGGTFTDLAAAESWSGRTVARKVAEHAARAASRGCRRARPTLLAITKRLRAVELLAHSTTIATNALLGQIGPRACRASRS